MGRGSGRGVFTTASPTSSAASLEFLETDRPTSSAPIPWKLLLRRTQSTIHLPSFQSDIALPKSQKGTAPLSTPAPPLTPSQSCLRPIPELHHSARNEGAENATAPFAARHLSFVKSTFASFRPFPL